MGGKRGTLEERFWRHVDKKGPDEHWEWTAARLPKGYGILFIAPGKTPKHTHRLSWEIANGPIPDGLCVLHRCDRPWCVNPRHLFLGSKADNNRDAKRKGRQARGEMIPQSVLRESEVLEIRHLLVAEKCSRKELARRFGVSRQTIDHVANGNTWRHLLTEEDVE